MIDELAGKLALTIKKANDAETASLDVMKFSLIILLNATLILVLTLSIGQLSGKFPETCAALAAFAMLRMVSGGYHIRSSDLCVAVSTLLLTVIPHIHVPNGAILYLNLAAILIILWKAPAGIKRQTRIPEPYFPLLKIISVLLVALNLIWMSPTVTLAFFTQALSLIFVKGGETDEKNDG